MVTGQLADTPTRSQVILRTGHFADATLASGCLLLWVF